MASVFDQVKKHWSSFLKPFMNGLEGSFKPTKNGESGVKPAKEGKDHATGPHKVRRIKGYTTEGYPVYG